MNIDKIINKPLNNENIKIDMEELYETNKRQQKKLEKQIQIDLDTLEKKKAKQKADLDYYIKTRKKLPASEEEIVDDEVIDDEVIDEEIVDEELPASNNIKEEPKQEAEIEENSSDLDKVYLNMQGLIREMIYTIGKTDLKSQSIEHEVDTYYYKTEKEDDNNKVITKLRKVLPVRHTPYWRTYSSEAKPGYELVYYYNDKGVPLYGKNGKNHRIAIKSQLYKDSIMQADSLEDIRPKIVKCFRSLLDWYKIFKDLVIHGGEKEEIEENLNYLKQKFNHILDENIEDMFSKMPVFSTTIEIIINFLKELPNLIAGFIKKTDAIPDYLEKLVILIDEWIGEVKKFNIIVKNKNISRAKASLAKSEQWEKDLTEIKNHIAKQIRLKKEWEEDRKNRK
jgi:hypothetical protein